MSSIRVLLDEHVSRRLKRALEEKGGGFDPLRVGEPSAPPTGTEDPDLLLWCEKEGRLFICGDIRTMPKHFGAHLAAGHHSPGVILYRRLAAFSLVLKDLLELIEGATPDDWKDRIAKVPLPRTSRRRR